MNKDIDILEIFEKIDKKEREHLSEKAKELLAVDEDMSLQDYITKSVIPFVIASYTSSNQVAFEALEEYHNQLTK